MKAFRIVLGFPIFASFFSAFARNYPTKIA